MSDSKEDRERGLYNKFRVERTDGTSEPGGKHHGCRYYVLDLDHDKHARPALVAYADSCKAEYPQLAADLMQLARHGDLARLSKPLTIYYFGCWHGAGHYLHDTEGRRLWRDESTGLPFPSRTLDAGFLPKNTAETEGYVCLTHHKGWTVIAFWDRSGDSRPGSNSAFAIEGEHAKDEALRLARESFPTVFARFKFKVA